MKRMNWMIICLATLCLIMAPLVGCAPEGVSQYKYDALQEEYDALNENVDEAKATMEIINHYFVPSLTGELFEMTGDEAAAWLLEWSNKIAAIGDPTLEELFQEYLNSFSDEAFASFSVYLFESTLEALE